MPIKLKSIEAEAEDMGVEARKFLDSFTVL